MSMNFFPTSPSQALQARLEALGSPIGDQLLGAYRSRLDATGLASVESECNEPVEPTIRRRAKP